MTQRPTREKLIEVITAIFGTRLTMANNKDVVIFMADQYLQGYNSGHEAGKAAAQRHLQLLLGVATPTTHESVYWNAPFPLLPVSEESA